MLYLIEGLPWLEDAGAFKNVWWGDIFNRIIGAMGKDRIYNQKIQLNIQYLLLYVNHVEGVKGLN